MSVTMSVPLSALVDLERYPLDDDAGFAPIAARCKAQLKESSFASLPAFCVPASPNDDARSLGCDTARLPARTIVQRLR
jgi:hypothetical protein